MVAVSRAGLGLVWGRVPRVEVGRGHEFARTAKGGGGGGEGREREKRRRRGDREGRGGERGNPPEATPDRHCPEKEGEKREETGREGKRREREEKRGEGRGAGLEERRGAETLSRRTALSNAMRDKKHTSKHKIPSRRAPQ